MNKKTAVLLIGFGGPNGMEEVRPFLESVLRGVRIPQARFDEVVHHYEIFGGRSRYNEITEHQRAALERWLSASGSALSVYVGLRHANPSFKETFLRLKADGVERVIGFVLSDFRAYASFEKYIERLEEGQKEADAADIDVTYTPIFNEEPLFIEAQSDRILETVSQERVNARETFFLFSAHSIPVPMSEQSGYARQFQKTSELIVSDLASPVTWGIGYQSRSGNPRDPWLEPDVKDVIGGLDSARFKNVLLVPVGFLCDNVEVLYDLDTETRDFCVQKGLRYHRAGTVADHPKFIEMIGRQVLSLLK